MSAPRVILHADMDAFYASIEQRDQPELCGRPVLVGGTGSRGVISAASYEARRFGVHSAMPTAQARQLCPHGVFLRGDMQKYAAVSRQVFRIFRRFSPRVEGISLDEAFLDLTGTERLLGAPVRVGEDLRAAVRAEVDLAVSVGIAPNKMTAKIASDEAKPDGLLEVPPEGVRAFLDPLPVGRVWGIGPVAAQQLREQGILTIGDLARVDPEQLERRLGSLGSSASSLARGIDSRHVEPAREAVSYSEENTFSDDVSDRSRLEATILDHAESVARRLRRDRVVARTVVLKVKLARRRRAGRYGYPVLTRRCTLREPTDDGAVMAREARALLGRMPQEPVRLVGVGVTNLRGAQWSQLGLFDAPEVRRSDRLNRALDEIVDRFGPRAVVRAGQERAQRAGLSLQHKRGEAVPEADDDPPRDGPRRP